MKLLLALTLALTLTACNLLETPPAIDDTPPIIIDPITPIPDPATVFAPVGACPILVTIEPAPVTHAIVRVELGNPCETGSLVPFAFREQLLWNFTQFVSIIDGVLTRDGSIHGASVARFAIPYSARARRFEIVDLRDGTAVGIQNFQLRNPHR